MAQRAPGAADRWAHNRKWRDWVMRCPVCSGSPEPLFVKYGMQILECAACGHRLAKPDEWDQHVERVYGDDYFSAGGAGYSDYMGEGPLLRAAGRRYGRLLARYTKPGRILDIGAAAGFVLKGFEDRGWACTGIEPNATMARHAREMLGLQVITGDLETFDSDETFDVVSLIQVIGHFRDPSEAMRVVASLVRTGSLVLIESWDRRSLTARMLGRHWHEYVPPVALHWFSLAGLCRLCESAGFLRVAHGRPLKMLTGGYVKALLQYRLPEGRIGAAASRIVNLTPAGLRLIYPFDDAVWILLRKV
jgi:SAM-dependent methyltransferase